MTHSASTPASCRIGFGPMSKNVVDAIIRLAYRHDEPIMIIASRGQVESEHLRRGYVENWSTEEFARYVRDRDPAKHIILCRDHGGPWQHPDEATRSVRSTSEVMASSRASLHADIDAGMRVLHIDTSKEGPKPAAFDVAVERLATLYGECQEFASLGGHRVDFEVGVEQQSSCVDDPDSFREKVDCILQRLKADALQQPVFIVGQTGTLVRGTENCGMLCRDRQGTGRQIRELAQICSEYGLALKAHNADYLSRSALEDLLSSGVSAVNIAPELGVAETLAFLELVGELRLHQHREAFLALAFESGAWRKWFADEVGTDLQRSVAAGHYVFASDAFQEIKEQVALIYGRRRGTTLDAALGAALDTSLERYAQVFWDSDGKGQQCPA
jgi:fructose/tagatose bisphosphate aldolase